MATYLLGGIAMGKNNMKSLIILLQIAILHLSLIGCKKSAEEISGPQNPSSDLSGTWLVDETISGNCPDVKYPFTRTDIYLVTQSGNKLTILTTSTGGSFEGTISADKVSWKMTLPESGGELKLNFSGTVSTDGQSITGNATWIWSLGNLSCSGAAVISASKVTQPILDVTGEWNGTWESITTGLEGEFTTAVVQQGGSLTGTISVLELGLNKAPLKGNVTGNTIAFGDINDQITFVGVLGEDTLTASGTYYYPALGDYGSWTADKRGSGGSSGLQIVASFPIPGEPLVTDMTYDGEDLWILAGKDNIQKFSTNGEFAGRYLTPGSYPVGATFDGKNLQVADSNWGNAKIFKLAIDGHSVIKAPGSGNSTGLASDGTYLWAADNDYQNPQIYKIQFDGTIVDSIGCPGSQIKGLIHDGQNLWLSAWDNAEGKIFKLDLSGNIIFSFKAPGFISGGLTFDGQNLWFSYYPDKKIYQIDTLGTVIDTIDAPSDYAGDLAFDGTYLWVQDEGLTSSHKIYQISTSGAQISSIETPGNSQKGLTFYNGSLWTCNYINKKIFKINLSDTYFSSLPEFEFKFLTYDGSHLWADDISNEKLHQIDSQGQILQSINLPCTDIGGITYHDAHFWIACKQGFTFSTLYKIDVNGNVVTTYQSDLELPDPHALTSDGVNFWYVGREPYSWSYKLHKLALE